MIIASLAKNCKTSTPKVFLTVYTIILSLFLAISSYASDLSEGISKILESAMNSALPLPKGEASGRSYSSIIGYYSYVTFNNSIQDQDLSHLENYFQQLGYYPLGRNRRTESKDTLSVECRNSEQLYRRSKNHSLNIYKSISRCRLLDPSRSNFIVYEGRGVSYGYKENARRKSMTLAFLNLQNSPQRKAIYVEVHGFDDGEITHRRKDYDEAISDAKLQALEKAGVTISGQRKYSLEYAHNKITDERFRQLIETHSNGVILPGYEIVDIGYEKTSYHVILKGYVLPDPLNYIAESKQPIQVPKQSMNKSYSFLDNDDILRIREVQNALEFAQTGEQVTFSHHNITYKMKILTTITSNTPCRDFLLNTGNNQNIKGSACRQNTGTWVGNINQ